MLCPGFFGSLCSLPVLCTVLFVGGSETGDLTPCVYQVVCAHIIVILVLLLTQISTGMKVLEVCATMNKISR